MITSPFGGKQNECPTYFLADCLKKPITWSVTILTC